MNTRLQVEHPVTEEVTGLDLVELQLRIAEGEPLPREAREAAISGHAIEARLYAEDVPAGFLPVTGTLHRFAIPSGPGLRIDTGYRDGSVVSPHYDAMLAKVIAHGRTRADAARRLARALQTAEIHGLTTNRDLLVAILREPDFLAGATDTGYLTRHEPPGRRPPGRAKPRHDTRWSRRWPARRSTGLAHRSWAPCPPAGATSSPCRSASATPSRIPPTSSSTTSNTASSAPPSRRPSTACRSGRRAFAEQARTASIWRSTAHAGCTGCTGSGPDTYVDASDGSSALTEVPRFGDPEKQAAAGSLLAPMPGLVRRVLVEVGTTVAAGQPLLVLEAMKMEQTVAAPAAGVVAELRAKAGEQVAAGQVLAVLRLRR